MGRAVQAFSHRSTDDMVGYLMGSLVLPPKGMKDPESTLACTQLFTVCSAQAGSVEIAIGDPSEPDGRVEPHTAQRFLLSGGDQFRIPPGNSYHLVNHSTSSDCVIAWTIIRPHAQA